MQMVLKLRSLYAELELLNVYRSQMFFKCSCFTRTVFSAEYRTLFIFFI